MGVFGRHEDQYASGHMPVDQGNLTVDRTALQNLYEHLNYVYDRFPTRRLRQSILIARHMLFDDKTRR